MNIALAWLRERSNEARGREAAVRDARGRLVDKTTPYARAMALLADADAQAAAVYDAMLDKFEGS